MQIWIQSRSAQKGSTEKENFNGKSTDQKQSRDPTTIKMETYNHKFWMQTITSHFLHRESFSLLQKGTQDMKDKMKDKIG